MKSDGTHFASLKEGVRIRQYQNDHDNDIKDSWTLPYRYKNSGGFGIRSCDGCESLKYHFGIGFDFLPPFIGFRPYCSVVGCNLETSIEGSDAASEHTVTLIPFDVCPLSDALHYGENVV
jgi:hypothetical protein